MKNHEVEVIRPGQTDQRTTVRRLGDIAVHRGDEILSEVPSLLRHIRTLIVVATVTLPLAIIGLIVLVWHLAH